MKMVNTEEEECLVSDIRNFNKIFRKNVIYNHIKSLRKAGLHLLTRKCIFGKTPRRGKEGDQTDSLSLSNVEEL